MEVEIVTAIEGSGELREFGSEVVEGGRHLWMRRISHSFNCGVVERRKRS